MKPVNFPFGSILILLGTLLTSAPLLSATTDIPKTGTNVSDFVPKGYGILEEKTGDLNHDGVPDHALVLKDLREDKKGDERFDANSRILVLLFGSPAGSFTRSGISEEEILGALDGGVLGDPFVGLEISKGVLIIQHYGGSNHRWGFTHRWRYQNGDWYLIGNTEMTEFILTQEMHETDTNLLTGDQIITNVTSDGRKKIKKNKVRKEKLRKLSDPVKK